MKLKTTPAGQGVVQHPWSTFDIAAHAQRLILIHNGIKDLQHRAPASMRSYFNRLAVVEDYCADTIAAAQHAPCTDCCRPGGSNGLHCELAAEEHRDALIDQQYSGSVTFLV